MIAKAGIPCTFVLALLVIGAARCGDPYVPPPATLPPATSGPASPSSELTVPGPATTPAAADARPDGPLQLTPPSTWVTYPQAGCCGPVGANGPIGMELYFRGGFCLPVGGGVLNNRLGTGWMVQGGGRSLFFNTDCSRAWTIDLGLAQMRQQGIKTDSFFILNDPVPSSIDSTTPVFGTQASVLRLYRTYVTASLGREYYLVGNGCCCGGGGGNGCANGGCDGRSGRNWRVGFDGGGGWGTARLDLLDFSAPHASNFVRRNDVFGMFLFALHTDVEIPCGCCTFMGGFRAEWNFQVMDSILTGYDGDVSNVNLLLTTGVRF